MPLSAPFVHAGGVWPRGPPREVATGATRPRWSNNAQIDRKAFFFLTTQTLCEWPEPTFLTADVSWVLMRGVRTEVLRQDRVVLPTAPSGSVWWSG